MESSGIERRIHKRTYFTVEDGVFAVVELPGDQKLSLSTNLLSLSEGGVSFIAQKDAYRFAPGSKLLLVRVFEPEELSFIHEIVLEIRHTIEDDDMPHIVCGCQFMEIPENQGRQIRDFVRTR